MREEQKHEEYYNQLVKFDRRITNKNQERAKIEDLTEEELEMYDLLVKWKKIDSKAEEQQCKISCKTSIYNNH